ncbi:MAG: RNA-binding S4 domain-containing protein [bacterium]
MRLDKFLQISRLVKRRAIAGALCGKGRVRVNGNPAKASAAVNVGDVITIAFGDSRLVAKVLSVPERAVPSKECVEILTRVDVHSLAER